MLADIIAAVNAELVTISGVTALIGEKNVKALGVPPRFVWVPLYRETLPASAPGANPPTLAMSQWTIEVRCWGSDLANAERLEQALLSSCARTIDGPTVQHVRTEPLTDEGSHMANGYILVVTLRFKLPMPEGKAGALADNTRPTVTINSTSFYDNGSVQGDGLLDVGES